MGRAITFRTSYPYSGRDAPTLRPARGKRMNVANEEVLPITKSNCQCAGSHGNGPVPELGTDNIGTGNTPTLATLNGRRWDGWNIIREIQWPVASGQWPVVTDNVWGLDLDGTLQGAGGVGGLLAVVKSDSATNNSPLATGNWQLFLPTYDANGNISEYVSESGEIVAHYDYSPFGETLIEAGDLTSTFTHRFSTKPWCPVTGLYEYQMRKYRPEIGRWMSRDPLEEGEHLHLYTFIRNNQVNRSDYVGLADSTSAWQLGIEWLTGNGPRHHNFTDGDPFAEELRTHSNIQEGLANAASQLALHCGNYNNTAFDFPHNYSLSGWEGIPKFIRDYSTVATGGATGNLSAAYLGSYRAIFYVTDIDCCKRTAHVLIIINNTSTAASGTRPPVIGYTQWWQSEIAPLINSAFNRGPGSTTTQHIELNENVTF